MLLSSVFLEFFAGDKNIDDDDDNKRAEKKKDNFSKYYRTGRNTNMTVCVSVRLNTVYNVGNIIPTLIRISETMCIKYAWLCMFRNPLG